MNDTAPTRRRYPGAHRCVWSSAKAAAHRPGRDFRPGRTLRLNGDADGAALAEAALPFSGGEGHASPVTPLRNGAPMGFCGKPPLGPLDRDLRGQGLAHLGGRSPRRPRRQLGRPPTTAAAAGHRSVVGSAGSGPAHRAVLGIREEPDGRSPGRVRTRRPGVRPQLAGFSARRSRDRLVPAGCSRSRTKMPVQPVGRRGCPSRGDAGNALHHGGTVLDGRLVRFQCRRQDAQALGQRP